MIKSIFYFIILITVSSSVIAQTPYVVFEKRYGGLGWDNCSNSIRILKDGSMLLSGGTDSGAGFDIGEPSNGGDDIWILVIDSSGIKVWDKRFGGSGFDGAIGSLITKDNHIMTYGVSDSPVSGDKTQPSWGNLDFWIVMSDSIGIKNYDRRYGGNLVDILYDAIETSDKGFLLLGQTYSGTGGDRVQPLWNSPGSGHGDFWAIKTDQAGNLIWEKVYGGNHEDVGRTIVPAGNNRYLLGGSIKSDNTGSVTLVPKGTTDYWIIMIDSMGSKVWDKRYGSGFGLNDDRSSYLKKILPLGNETYILAGHSDGGLGYDKSEMNRGHSDYWIIKIDKMGNRLWDRTYGGNRQDELSDIIQTPDGGFLLGGSSKSGAGFDKSQPNWDPALQSWDYWIVKTDSLGNKMWDYRVGGIKNDYLYSLAISHDGHVLLAGSSDSPPSGNKLQPPIGWYDTWVVKLSLPAPSGIGETPLLPAVSVYPNPFSSTITVTAENIPGPTATLTLRNLLGEEILSQQTPVIERTLQKQLHMPPLPPGMYLLTLATESGNQVLKVVKGN